MNCASRCNRQYCPQNPSGCKLPQATKTAQVKLFLLLKIPFFPFNLLIFLLYLAGTTAAVVVVKDNELLAANIGDTEIVLGQGIFAKNTNNLMSNVIR